MQAIELLTQPLLELLHTLPIDSTRARVPFHLTKPSPVLALVELCPPMSEPSSLRSDSTSPQVSSDDDSGSFTKELVHASSLLISLLAVSTILPAAFPSPLRCRLRGHVIFHQLRVLLAVDHSPGFASHFARAYRYLSRAIQEPCEFSWGHAQIFRTVPSANTLVRWVNENAFAP